MHASPSKPSSNQSAGFALIASLSIMAILVMIAVALYSMSAVATRSADIAAARVEAQANAKMALMQAIGELQKYTGPDTRITAPANILANDEAELEIVDDNMPKLVGAWRSWEGLNHDSTGRPIAEIAGTPIYDLKQQPNDPNDPSDTGRFLSWLVSSATPGNNLNDPQTLAYLTETTVDNITTVPLLTAGESSNDSDGSLRDADPGNSVPKPREIHVVPTATNERDRYAWWVSPENQKARLQQPYEPQTQDEYGWAKMSQTHALPDPSIFGFDEFLNEPENFNIYGGDTNTATKAFNLKSTELLKDNNPVNPHLGFHDFSVTATGLLTNTATGGWRKDLSILSEKWDDIYANYPGGKLPLFRYSLIMNDRSEANQPTTTNPTAEQSIFYPWSDYLSPSSTSTTNPNTFFYAEQHGASSSWQSMINFITSYKEITYDSASGVGSTPITWARTHKITDWGPSDGNYSNTDLFNYLHQNQFAPALARVQWVFHVRSRRKNYTDEENANYNRFVVDLKVAPIYTLWNPYNVALEVTDHFGAAMQKSFPIAIGLGKSPAALDFRRYISGSKYWTYRQGDYDSTLPGNYTNHWEQTNGQGVGFPNNITFNPGEVKIFSLFEDVRPVNSGAMGAMQQGYSGGNVHGYVAFNGNNKTPNHILDNWNLSDSLHIGMRFDNITQLGPDPEDIGPGIQLNFGRWGPNTNNPQYLGDGYITYSMLTSENFSTTYWQEPSGFPTYSMLDILVEPDDLTANPITYDSYNSGTNPPWTPIFSVVFGPRMSIGAGAGNTDDRPTKGVLQNNPFTTSALTSSINQWTNHPANIPFDFSAHPHEGGNSPTLPSDSIEAEGYLFTGMQEGNGLSRIVFTELPLTPMASLTELQNWNLQGNKAIPPFSYNLIGNSDASPLIEPNSVLPADPVISSVAENLQHDDAYCANHLLFDDWFFSSIAPQPTNFGSTLSKDIETVYEEYLEGDLQLTNRAYQPIPEDRNLSTSEASTLANAIINSPSGDGWLKVASRFTVDGMFNVNSTSVKAWRALLGHARELKVAHHTADGIVLDNTARDHVVSRHAVAADVAAGTDRGMGAAFTSGSEYAGFRTLSDTQLDELAESIVDQVRARGPFLSLAEFINRQLSTNQDLAIAGALQAALNNLSEDPVAALKNEGANDQLSSETMDPSDSKLNGVGYAFEQAAEGFSTHGFPGWIRQADILRPIAPILSARDDTFTIRAYGDKRDASGKIIARAWCEATVHRSRDYVDASDDADSIDTPTSAINQVFGRKYTIKSFRWLDENEV